MVIAADSFKATNIGDAIDREHSLVFGCTSTLSKAS